MAIKLLLLCQLWGKETDRLLSLQDKLEEYRNSDDIASLLSSGEQVSSSFFQLF